MVICYVCIFLIMAHVPEQDWNENTYSTKNMGYFGEETRNILDGVIFG